MTMASNLRVWRLIPLLLFAVFFCPFAHGKVIYVDDDAVGNNDGTNWQNAYTFLQDALADAEAAVKPVEIRVAQGIYKPYQGSWEKATDSIASFQLINDVTIAGGYAGFGESDPNARNIELYETILSGDLNSNDIEANDPCDMLLAEFNRGDNSNTIIKGSNTNASAVLDGLTITGGYSTGISMGPLNGGAGMYIASGSPTIINCTFKGNATSQAGGGMYNIAGSPTVIDCKFENNYAEFGAGMYNTYTIYIPQRSKPVLINCSFDGNYSGREGGGIYNFKSDPDLTNCTFSHNFALVYGAGIYNSYNNIKLSDTLFIENTAGSGGGIYSEDNSSLIVTNCNFRNNIAKAVFGGGICNWDANELIVTNCTFSGNVAMRDGGGILNRRTSSTLKNCIFTGNKAYGELLYTGEGGGLYAFGDTILNNCTFSGNWAHQGRAISKYSDSFLRLNNCILWNGGDEIFDLIPNRTTLDISYSNIKNGWEGKCNINEDPLFANPGYWANADDPNIVVEPNDPNTVWIDGDYHLKSQAGRWDPVSESWIQDDVTSPCIDTGDPNSPIGHEPFPNGGIINLGAYGGTPEASKSYILSKIIYVDDDAVGLNDGSSWQNAYTFLQDALADANSAEKSVEIRVAQGIYKPDRNSASPNGTSYREATFKLINDVTIKGGYAGISALDPDVRDIDEYETILSGDLAENDIDINDPCDFPRQLTRIENSYHVVTGSNMDTTAILDGFTIANGNAEPLTSYAAPTTRSVGGGMYIVSGSPTVANCTFDKNLAGDGGGMYNGGGNPTLTNCIFIGNFADMENEVAGDINICWGGDGAGMYNTGSSPTLINCTFTSNWAEDSGGGMHNEYNSDPTLCNCEFSRNTADLGGGMDNFRSSPTLTNCSFSQNRAGNRGGGIYNPNSSMVLVNCKFTNNQSYSYGGGIYNREAEVILDNCIFTGNVATWIGGGVHRGGGAIYNSEGSNAKLLNCTFTGNLGEKANAYACGHYLIPNYLQLINCILWDGGTEIANQDGSTIIISHTNVQEGWPGEGNIDIDPCFVNPGYWANADDPNIAAEPYDPKAVWVNGDYHLKSQAGRWDPASENWVVDDITSPCIDTGDPNILVGDEPEPNGGRINMGAYGGTEQASLSLSTVHAVGKIPP